MRQVFPPLCLFLALAMIVAGFALWVTDPPEPDVEMHRAGARGDEQLREVMEDQLRNRRRQRKTLIVCLFLAGGVLLVTGFWSMRPAESQSN